MTFAEFAVDRDALRRARFERLQLFWRVATRDNAFQSAKFRAAGFDSPPRDVDDFLARAPLTTKAELIDDQARNPPYGSNLSNPLEPRVRYCQTSGTTADPLRRLDTAEDWAGMVACWDRVFEAADVGSSDRVFFPFSFGPFLGFWTAFDAAVQRGCLAIPAGGIRSAARARMILDNRATVVCATPTYAMHLAEAGVEAGVDLAAGAVRRIIVAGEPGGSIPATRACIERLWPGARVVDHHGLTEVGPVSYECPRRPGVLHVIEAAYLPEVRDPETLAPVAPGEQGELILTTLGRWGCPLSRYRTGDVVRRGEDARCECGSWELALEGGVLGRVDDMLVVRGVNVFPSAVENAVRGVPGVAEYRLTAACADRALPELSIEVEAAPEVDDPIALAERVEEALHRVFSLRIPARAAPRGALPRFEAKACRWAKV